MGIIRKSLAVSTLGGVKYTSKREATTKNASAQARLAKAETKLIKAQTAQLRVQTPAKPGFLDRLALASGTKWFYGTAPGGWKCDHRHPSLESATECGRAHIRGES
jgi:hypothetical protein